MADLTALLGDSFTPPDERIVDTPEQQLRSAMIEHGITPPDQIIMDGQLHRFRSGTKGKASGDKTGWYVCHGDGVPAGRFGCWREGMDVSFRAEVGRDLSPAEEMAHARRMAEARAARDAERERLRAAVSETTEAIWEGCAAASADHPYLRKKGIQPNGARVTGDGRLVVPLYNAEGAISSLQYIDGGGSKLYHAGGKTGGCFWMIGATSQPGPVYIAEGFATAATIHEVSGRPCVAAYSASNLTPVAEILRQHYGESADLVVVADNDESGVGQKCADKASAKHGCRVVTLPERGDANDYVQAGGDLMEVLMPSVNGDQWLARASEFCQQQVSVKWLVRDYIQDNALIMVHGPSGGGKTFYVLSQCLAVSGGYSDWFGKKVNPGPVVYLAGEGHNGLRGRITAWMKKTGTKDPDLWLSRGGVDLNTPEGYRYTMEHIRQLPVKPRLIVVDTLHRHLSGDENSAQDAKTMIDACNRMMEEMGCSVLLVHHTGVGDESQHRARGSSAWRGALDIEISVVPPKGDNPGSIVQRKTKDSEEVAPIYFELEQVDLGWLDDDGEPVGSAVFQVIEHDPAPVVDRATRALNDHIQPMIKAFREHPETHEGHPYISTSALKDQLRAEGVAESTINQKVKPSAKNHMVGKLVDAGWIEPAKHGFIITHNETASALLIGVN